MYEFMGAVCGRSLMREGVMNNEALFGGLLGLLMMQGVAWYTEEDILVYMWVFMKYTAFWFFSSIIMGALVYLVTFGKYQRCFQPKCAAWPAGPYLNPFARALREVIASVCSVLFPVTDFTWTVIQHGGYKYLAFAVSTGYVAIVIFNYYEEWQDNKKYKTKTD
ncbi:hypothetical protein HDV06_003330 [Boothiomyces sp. JEL0866]|nr:hypothetical protein HDV06_003330 [Boothiomyces sp. JEL0866]